MCRPSTDDIRRAARASDTSGASSASGPGTRDKISDTNEVQGARRATRPAKVWTSALPARFAAVLHQRQLQLQDQPAAGFEADAQASLMQPGDARGQGQTQNRRLALAGGHGTEERLQDLAQQG